MAELGRIWHVPPQPHASIMSAWPNAWINDKDRRLINEALS